MTRRTLGRTGLGISAVAFGAGPVSGLMTGGDVAGQLATVRRALDAGINWFDTAPGYGQGQSEANLGRVLVELGVVSAVHIATKVRVPASALDRIGDHIRHSVQESLSRLRVPRLTLLQLHNGITIHRGDEPDAITPRDILGPGGVAESLARLQREGLVAHVGLTGSGHPVAMREVVRSGLFDTMQVPFNILNPSAGPSAAAVPGETDYGRIIGDCAAMGMGVFAIRVFAGGALFDQPPSTHTLKTTYFPLALYQRDLERARLLRQRAVGRMPLAELALRFVLSRPEVASAIIGFGSPAHADDMVGIPLDQPLPADLL